MLLLSEKKNKKTKLLYSARLLGHPVYLCRTAKGANKLCFFVASWFCLLFGKLQKQGRANLTSVPVACKFASLNIDSRIAGNVNEEYIPFY